MAENSRSVNTINEDGTPKTAKQLEKEAKKAAKLAKFNEKKAKIVSVKTIVTDPSSENIKLKDKKASKKEEKAVVTYDLETPPGEKKNTSVELPVQYSPSYVEAAWYDWWKKRGFFKPEYGRDITKPNPLGNFVMVIPPPNVTGSLHLGHALTNSVEDAITRWHRMKGRTTLWVPGCDHAGIATQVVVEKKLMRDEGKTRHDYGREEFVKRVWQWKEEKGNRIYKQLECMGSSLDWDRVCFTMDPGPQEAVKESFVRLYEEGIIYRSNRLVNWSCSLKSAISDIEVEKRELSGRTELPVPGYDQKVEFGVLVQFAYPVQGSEERLVVATTRIETMLGDTAVAVHPEDNRYSHLHGKNVVHPITNRVMPIITDSFVDLEFGTGAVKITPAHDPNDYEVGKRHNLEFVNILSDDGRIIDGYGEFSGQHRFECRVKLLAKLKELGYYVDTKDNPMVVPVCSRSKDIIEPMLKPQWYVRCGDMAADAMAVVASGELELIPKSHEKTWNHWMSEIKDWCISRQLWWGHRIPAYYVTLAGQAKLGEAQEDPLRWIVARTEVEARSMAAKLYKVAESELSLEQDPDVLDTWYSSALFPFSVMGWPKQTQDLELFYPGTLLETGHDILFFWVARMVFFGRKLLGKLPFKQVYLHAMVRDAHGRKMSKSLGNVIDPMDVMRGITLEELHKQLEENSNLDPKEIEKAKAGQKADYPKGIPECGTDALRFALCAYTSQGRDINLDVLRVNGYRNFCNKLWNATKFAVLNFGAPFKPIVELSVLKQEAFSCRNGSPLVSSTELAALNVTLAHSSYLTGYHPTYPDAALAEFLSSQRSHCQSFPHLWRWLRHMESFSCTEKRLLPCADSEFTKLLGNAAQNPNGFSGQICLTVVDRWMLSQLAAAVRDCNEGFQDYNFPQATTALYTLWWYNICDIYLECIKPRLYGEPSPNKTAAQQVLWTCLHTGLRLISPFMPFLSEELYQRLPLSEAFAMAESICVAPYPEFEHYAAFIDEAAEEQFKLGQKVISEVRSAKAKYDIPNKTKIELCLQCESDATEEIMESLCRDIATLSVASRVTVSKEQPSGSVPTPITADCIAWMKLQGLVDLSKCEERLQKKLADCVAKLSALHSDMGKDSYVKVPEEVKKRNAERLKDLQTEEEQTKDALVQLATMSRQ